MPNSSASSSVAGASSARITSEEGTSPSRAAVSLNDSRVLGNSLGTLADTYQPRPCEDVSTPSSTRLCRARRSVTRLIDSCFEQVALGRNAAAGGELAGRDLMADQIGGLAP